MPDYIRNLLLRRADRVNMSLEVANNAQQTHVRIEPAEAFPVGYAEGGRPAVQTTPGIRVMELLQMESNRVEQYRDARLDVDFRTHGVILDGAPVRLTKMEFALLAQLARKAGEIVPRDALMLNVWGYGPEIHSRTMDVHLRRLRVKLGSYSRQHVETVFGLGYRLQPSTAQPLAHAAGA